VSARPNHAFSTTLFAELTRAGLAHVCVCPGSRSTPLAVAAFQNSALRCWSYVDERSAAFFALGLAKARREPVALVCTSGTAAANFHPAVVEAHHARVPLLVLSADRPPELRDWGAGQTIDQLRLYGGAVRWFVEAPVPEDDGAAQRYARALACRALAQARGRPAGPVHVNLPFREPLEPGPAGAHSVAPLGHALRPDSHPYTEAERGARVPSPEWTARIAALLESTERGIVSCGPLDDPDAADAIAGLARALGWPLLAEPTSQLRRGPHVADTPLVSTSDLFLRDAASAERLAAECVLRFGDTPTSKAFRLWLERHPPRELIVVDPDGVWHDPSHLASVVLRVDPAALCDQLARRLGPGRRGRSAWLDTFLATERAAASAVDRSLAECHELLEPRAVRELAAALPADAVLYVSNSMPVRDLDAFLPPDPQPLRVLSNRGANGIDGMVSSALGAAAAMPDRQIVLLTGDLAFLHDAGGLLAARRHGLSATIVVVDNDGGGIFSFLPIAQQGERVGFEECFRTPHGLDLGAVARAYGAGFTRVASWEHFRTALKEAFASRGVSVIALPVSAERSVEAHRGVESAVRAILAAPRELSTEVEAAGVRLHARIRGEGPPLLLLHGFTGSGASLADLAARLAARFRTVRLDLVGHGRSEAPRDPGAYRMESCVDQVCAALDALGIPTAHLLGYSMGGRVALALCAWRPERARSALLVAASAGLEHPGQRAARRTSDEELARRIETQGIQRFVDEWMALPLFASQRCLGRAALAAARAQRLANRPHALALSLRGMGSGAQPPLHASLAGIEMPLLFVAGELDAKFAAVARDLAARAPRGRAESVAGAGHACHLEDPEAVARLAESFFEEMEPRT
jgi:2-succinyl-5-enolpyruvyl-6-hydroxy-3-cyclohexene-1-carboxylate synthase